MTNTPEQPEPQLPSFEGAEMQKGPVPSFEMSVREAAGAVEEFNLFYADGLNTSEGSLTRDSLMRGLEGFVAEADAEDANPAQKELFMIVAEASRAKKEQDQHDNAVQNPYADPLIVFLRTREQSYEKRPDRGPVTNTKRRVNTNPNDQDDGHQIIADGYVVRGEVVPGVGVKTRDGVLRTRGEPRVWGK